MIGCWFSCILAAMGEMDCHGCASKPNSIPIPALSLEFVYAKWVWTLRVMFTGFGVWSPCIEKGYACTVTPIHMCTFAQINQPSPPPSLPVVYGSPVGSHISLPLMVTRMIHGFQRPFVFITPPRQLAVAVSRFRATQANSGQNERKEFWEGRFFFWHGKKQRGLVFGTDKKLKAGRRTPVAAFFPPTFA